MTWFFIDAYVHGERERFHPFALLLPNGVTRT